MTTATAQKNMVSQVITPAELLNHWQGHRRLTRKVIEAFPEKDFFNYSIGGMRPFAEMVMELLAIAAPGLEEIVTGMSSELNEKLNHENKKEKILEYWDESTDMINKLWSQITMTRFHEIILAFGQYENSVQCTIFYFIDNEIHHRGQAYVYLRSLGIEPPVFWDR